MRPVPQSETSNAPSPATSTASGWSKPRANTTCRTTRPAVSNVSRTTLRPCFLPKYVPHNATYAVLPSRANAIPAAAECGSRYAIGGVTPAQPCRRAASASSSASSPASRSCGPVRPRRASPPVLRRDRLARSPSRRDDRSRVGTRARTGCAGPSRRRAGRGRSGGRRGSWRSARPSPCRRRTSIPIRGRGGRPRRPRRCPADDGRSADPSATVPISTASLRRVRRCFKRPSTRAPSNRR